MHRKIVLASTLVLSFLFGGVCLSICPPRPQTDVNLLGLAKKPLDLLPNLLGQAFEKTVDSKDTCHILVLLVDFDDKPHSLSAWHFQNKLFGSESKTFATYFDKNSYGKFKITGDVYGWIRSDCPHSQIVNRDGIAGTSDDYGLDTSGKEIQSNCGFPLNIWGLVVHAIEKASKSIDLTRYDRNGDFWLDALIVIHSGLGAEFVYGRSPLDAPNYIWSLKSSLEDYRNTRGTCIRGVNIGAFVIVPEFAEIGTYAHEFCHLLGLPDLYDTRTGQSVVGRVCLMDNGSWNGPNDDGSVPSSLSAPMKYFLGWLEPDAVCIGCDDSESKQVSIPPQSLEPIVYQVLSNPRGADWSPKGTGFGEYFLVENRQREAGQFDAYLPGSGLLIWRVDESQKDNNDPKNRLVTLVEANPNQWAGESEDFWPGPLNKTELTPYTNPSSSLNNGRFSGVAITDIESAGLEIKARISVGMPKRGLAYAFPNPYRIGETAKLHIVFVPEAGPEKPGRGAVSAMIFDLEGNFVRKLDQEDEILENGVAVWDIKDEAGRNVRPGLYFFVVNSSRKQASGTVLIKP